MQALKHRTRSLFSFRSSGAAKKATKDADKAGEHLVDAKAGTPTELAGTPMEPAGAPMEPAGTPMEPAGGLDIDKELERVMNGGDSMQNELGDDPGYNADKNELWDDYNAEED